MSDRIKQQSIQLTKLLRCIHQNFPDSIEKQLTLKNIGGVGVAKKTIRLEETP